jgi:hypothetical protein
MLTETTQASAQATKNGMEATQNSAEAKRTATEAARNLGVTASASEPAAAAAAAGEAAAAATAAAKVSEESLPLEEEEYRKWKKTLLDKCVEGLHLCLSRFPTHHKSLYRLAYLYFASDTHKVRYNYCYKIWSNGYGPSVLCSQSVSCPLQPIP